MQTICNSITSPTYQLKSSYFLLDIETTGLLKNNHAIICIGVIYKDNDGQVKSTQWFAENKCEEAQVLKHFLAFCSSYQKVCTYNGSSFDIPFILSRLIYHDLAPDPFKTLLVMDFKRILGKLNLNRGSLEQLLGYCRTTSVTGKELVKLYNLHETNPQPSYQKVIIDHNLDELRSQLVLHEFYLIVLRLPDYKLLSQKTDENYLYIQLQTTFNPHTRCSLAMQDIHLSWTSNSSIITLRILLHHEALKKYLTPVKDYFFIKDQNQIVHKSIAQFIPKSLKQKLSPKDCYITQSGTFIKCPSDHKGIPADFKAGLVLEIWYDAHDTPYIYYEQSDLIFHYLTHQLKFLLLSLK